MKSPTDTLKGTFRSSLHEDSKNAPSDIVLHLTPASITNLFNIDGPVISGTIKDTGDREELTEVNLRFPVSKDGQPLCQINILVDNIPYYVRDECLEECNRTIMRYMIAEAFLAPRD